MTTTLKHSLGTQTEPGTLRMERTLPAPIDRVWTYLVDPEKRRTWLAGGTMAQAVGGVFELRFQHTELSGEVAPERYAAYRKTHLQNSRVLRIEAPTLLVISWGSEREDASEVTFELSPQGEHATRLVLTHRRLPDRKETLSVSSGWHAHLDVLDDVLHGRQPQGFWTHLEAAEAAYATHIR
ncbi:SRPBCC family protein [Acidovorax cavernicola]|uniref:ATPase n=1 Tax=Acidovorax cavernicola TaxID=1675792 RepID=A0A9X8GX18_9BURK|nr:SRPBCC family protein [Acidovorax cavernicola]RIX83686.1 ATPase [Acidovorax cavernicola]